MGKIANSNALSNLRGQIVGEISELFSKMKFRDTAKNDKKKGYVVPLYMPALHKDIWIGDETESVYKLYVEDGDPRIFVETNEDSYVIDELFADDLMNILDFMDWICQHQEKYKEFMSFYNDNYHAI